MGRIAGESGCGKGWVVGVDWGLRRASGQVRLCMEA
jgi:predicted ABC-type transport system involved in lysophospholipase L1 biosynthesis ATPase subunit